MKFFEVLQNNSGGSFIVDNTICHRLFIEADDYKEATRKVEELGCYWNGVEEDLDCPCCGDRWFPPQTDDEKEFSNEEGKIITEYVQRLSNQYGWTEPDARIFYKNGTVTEIFTE